MTIEELYSHLLTHEMCLEHNASSVEPLFPSANVASARPFSHKSKGLNRGSSHPNGSSRNSSNGFHYRGRFSRGRGSYNSPNSHPARSLCQVCNKSGHTALTCHHRFDYSFQQEHSQNMQAFTASSSSTNTDLNWYPDT